MNIQPITPAVGAEALQVAQTMAPAEIPRGGGTGVNTTGGTPLVVDHYVDSETGTFAGSQINDLIAAIQNKNTRSNSVFYVPFYVVGDSVPRQARVTKANKKVEKFEHQYKAACVVNGTTTNVFYYIDDGINLSSMNVANLVGWRCSANNQLYGSTISGVSGDITLTAEFLGMNATPDKTVLYGGSSVASDKTATITITDADGTVSVDSTSSSLLSTAPAVPDASDPSTYTMEITLNDTSMFADDTPANLVLTDGSSTRTVTFTLKNKYSVEVQYGASAGEMGTFLQGSPVTFATAATAASTMIPAGREAVAFKYGSNIVLYKNASAGATSVNVSSTTFTGLTSRQIILDPVLDFTWSYTSGGDTSVTGQNGSAANPYILKYNGTAAQQVLNFAIADKTGNVNITTNAGSWLSIGGTQTNPTIELYAPAVVEANIPAGGKPFTVTLTDSGTGATKDIYVKVTKAPVIPNFTVTVTAPTSHVAAKSSGTTYALANLTDTFKFEPYSAEGFPDGTTFSWDITITTSGGGTITVPTATGDSYLLNLSARGLTDATIGRAASEATDISVVCTANNAAAAVTTKACTTPGNAKAFLLYTLPAFTISAAPTSYDANNTSISGGVTTYALTSASTSIDLTATSSGAAFPAGTTFDWTVDGYSLTGGASQHEATVNGVGLSGLGITLSSSSATPTSIVITCTAKNANATADLDATDFTLKLFRLTIPAYKITVTPPTGIDTYLDDSGDTVYLVTDNDLTTKQFRLKVEPENSGDTIPSGTQFTWSFDSTASTTNPRDVYISTMCGGITSVSFMATEYTISCTASLTGAVVIPTTPVEAKVKLRNMDVPKDEFGAYLASLPDNDVEHPYKIKITGSYTDLGSVWNALTNSSNRYKYVDLSPTTLPDNITELGERYHNFISCFTLVESPVLPATYNGSMEDCFSGCINLKTAPAIPDGVTSMENCFNGCSSLTDISAMTIPESVTSMKQCFSNCTGITNVSGLTIPGNVTTMENCFYGCTGLTDVSGLTISSGTANLTLKDCFHDCTELVDASFTLPNRITSMEYCFSSCPKLTTAPIIPEGVTSMYCCFYNCSDLSGTITINTTSCSAYYWSSCFFGCSADKIDKIRVPDATVKTNVKAKIITPAALKSKVYEPADPEY